MQRSIPRHLRRINSARAEVYNQLNAPLGSVGKDSLRFANRSILSDDTTYGKFLTIIADITSQRDAVAAEIKSALDAAAFDNQPIKEQDRLVRRARAIIERVSDLAHDDRDHNQDHH